MEGAYNLYVDYALVSHDPNARPERVTLKLDDGDAISCGQSFTLSGRQGDNKLFCVDGRYAGTFQSDVGIVSWQMRSKKDPEVRTDFRLADSFVGKIEIPGIPGIGQVRMERIADEPGFAPPCVCEEVEGYIASGKQTLGLYQDQNILDAALQNKQAGVKPGEVAWPNGKDDGSSYQTSRIVLGTKTRQSLPSYQFLISQQMSAPAGSNPQNYSAAASTNSITCEVNHEPPPEGVCRPPVVQEAIDLHENAHSNRCLELNGGENDPMSYTLWSNHPPNHAKDEIDAYTISTNHMVAWYGKNCP